LNYWNLWATCSRLRIAFATDEVGYISVQIDKTGGDDFTVYWTINGGRTWALGESRCSGDLFKRDFNRIAVPVPTTSR
jgi:hypothetical protein